MPTYDLRCTKCGVEFEALAGINEVVSCSCGGVTERMVPKRLNVVIPDYMKAGHDDSKYKAWFNSPDTQAKIKSGEYEFAPKGD